MLVMLLWLAVLDFGDFSFEFGEVVGVGLQGFGLLAAGVEFGVGVRDVADHFVMGVAAAAGKDGNAVVFEELVHGAAPIGERQVFAHFGAQFGALEEDGDEAVERVNLVCRQVVLGDDDVAFAHDAPLPGRECHVLPGGVGTRDDEVGGGLAGHAVDEFVLDFSKEALCGAVGLVVVGGKGEKVAEFLVEALFAGPDVADPREEFVEVVRAAVGVLQAFVVDDEAFLQVFVECRVRPAAELGATRGTDAETDGEDGIEAVKGQFTFYGTCPLLANL